MVNVKAMGVVLAAAAAFSAAPAAAVVPVTGLTSTATATIAHAFTSTANFGGGGSITLSATPANILVSQFDTRGGRFTITGVRVTVNRTLLANISLTSGSGNNRIGDFSYTVNSAFGDNTLGINPGASPGLITVGGSVTGISIPGQVTTNLTNQTLGASSQAIFNPSNFVPWAGTGNVTLQSTISNLLTSFNFTTGGQGNLTGTINGTLSGDVGVVYTYTDNVPEPSSWAMMIAGFGLVGAAARRRRPATA